MKKVLIGCGVVFALGVVAVIVLIAFAPTIFRWAVGDQLVGAIAFQEIQVEPGFPTADDIVSLKVHLAFAGTAVASIDKLQLQVTVEKKGEKEQQSASVALSRAAGAGSSGVMEGKATIEVGKLPVGSHTFTVAIQQPEKGLVGAIEPPRQVEVVVKPKPKPEPKPEPKAKP